MINFSVDKGELLAAVNVVARNFMFASHVTDLLRCLKFSVNSKGISFIAMDGYSELELFDIKVENYVSDGDDSFSFLLMNDLIHKILIATDVRTVKFQITDAHTIIKTESTYKVGHMPVHEYPATGNMLEGCSEGTRVEDISFMRVLDVMTPFVTNELSTPHLAGIAITDQIYISTDGVCGVVHAREENSFGLMTLYPYFVKIVSSILDVKGFEFFRSDSSFVIKGNGFIYRGRLPTTEFPYNQIDKILGKMGQGTVKLSVQGSKFFKALNRITVIAGDKFSGVNISIDEDSLQLLHTSEKSGISAAEKVLFESVEKQGVSNVEIRFSLSAIESCKKVFEESSALLTFTYVDERSPMFISQKGCKYLFFIQQRRPS